jgi:hypothetical protein
MTVKQAFEARLKRRLLLAANPVLVQQYKSSNSSNSNLNRLYKLVKGKPFYIWDLDQHRAEYRRTKGKCCFNDIIGLPQKDGTPMGLFDYEKLVIDTLEKEEGTTRDKHLWILKATGLGITELILRYLAWLCLRDNKLKGCQMCIVTAPRVELAITLIDRIKGLFAAAPLSPHNIFFDSKETVIELNECHIEAYPSNNALKDMRGLTDVKFILMDEGDYFRKNEQKDARDVSERYIGKSDPYIVMVSTPNAPGGLFETIEREPDDKCLYRRLRLDYRYGLGKIYTEQEIERAKASPSFDREYDLKYLGLIGNVFSSLKIERAIDMGKEYHDPNLVNVETPKYIGIDPGFGSSNFGICLSELGYDDKIHVLYADEYEDAMFQDMVKLVANMYKKVGNVENVYVDGSNPEYIRALKLELGGERLDYHEELAELKKNNMDIDTWGPKVMPVNFSTEHKELLGRVKHFVDSEFVSIPPKFDKLTIALRTATAYDWTLDKESTSFPDTLDAFRLSLKGYKIIK